MIFKNNKYLGVKPASGPRELFYNYLFFYFLPCILISIFLNFELANFISFYLSYGIIVFYLVTILIFMAVAILATLNVLEILKSDYNKNYSSFKKVVFFLLLQIPFLLHANFVTMILTKKYPNLKYRPLLILNYFLVSVTLVLLQTQLSALVLNQTRKQMNPKDSYVRKNTKIEKASSKYTGKVYLLKTPMFIQWNLPKGFRRNSDSVYKEEGMLIEFVQRCSNCLDSKRLENPIKLQYLPKGSKIEVIEAFTTQESGDLGGSAREKIKLVIKDEKGNRAEVQEYIFESNVLNSDSNNDYSPSLLDLLDELDLEKSVERMLCSPASTRFDSPVLKKSLPFEYNDHILPKLYKFLKDFDLKDQFEILNTANAKTNDSYVTCAHIKFKTINSIALFFYYGSDWNLNTSFYELSNFDEIQQSEFVPINYNTFINLKEEEILKQYP